MRILKNITYLLVILLAFSACAKKPEPTRYDITSNETKKESLKKMMAELPEKKAKQLRQGMMEVYTMAGVIGVTRNKSAKEIIIAADKKMGGKTADEIFALFEAMKEEAKRIPKSKIPTPVTAKEAMEKIAAPAEKPSALTK